jgi:hypothetical protein
MPNSARRDWPSAFAIPDSPFVGHPAYMEEINVTFRHLRRYDVQATYGCALSLVSLAPFAGAVVLSFRNYHHDLGQILYSAEGAFLPIFLVCLLVSIAPSTIGFFLGWNSAGQRRNDKPVRSWIGFFIGGGVLTFDLILLVAFWMLRVPI